MHGSCFPGMIVILLQGGLRVQWRVGTSMFVRSKVVFAQKKDNHLWKKTFMTYFAECLFVLTL